MLELTLRDPKLLHPPNFVDCKLYCLLPVPGLRCHSQRRHRAALPAAVAEVQIERGDLEVLVAGKVGVEPELEHTQHDPTDEAPLEVLQVLHPHDRELAEHVDAELVEQRVPEYRRFHRLRDCDGESLVLALQVLPEPIRTCMLVQVPVGVLHGGPYIVPGSWHRVLSHPGQQVSEGVPNHGLHLITGLKVTDDVQRRVRGEVPLIVKFHEVLPRPLLDLLLQADGESAAERVLLVQVRQELDIDPVVNRVHHLHLCKDCAALLLHPRRKQVGLKGYLP
mmetsp:Transcript_10587/g.36588  ORF Transcript_10587/g.36588 Transcript_10587/m.36588 type:complete len:279 (-) Transcript_10587:616-1452(-)